MTKIAGISAVLIVKNEEKVLEGCLRSLEHFKEVVIYLNNSTDASVEIAAGFPNVKVTTGPFLGFGPTRNVAAKLASNDWILMIDADERCSPELAVSLAKFRPANDLAMAFYRKVHFFMDKKFKAEWLPRIYHRGRCKLEKMVHEELVATAGSKDYPRIAGDVLHYMPSSLTVQFEKARNYASLAANAGKTRRSLPIASLLALNKFIVAYFLRLGFLNGKAGLYYAWLMCYIAYVKYTVSTDTSGETVSQVD